MFKRRCLDQASAGSTATNVEASIQSAPEAEAAPLHTAVVPRFVDLSEDVHEATLLCLWGSQAAAATAAAARVFRGLLADDTLWKQFVCQEFPTRPDQADGSYQDLYKKLHERQCSKSLKWKRLPCDHDIGSREGSPGVFARHGYLFVFGGWGNGPESDLHVGKLSVPLKLNEVRIAGSPPPATYEAKVTVLDDDAGIPGRQAGTCEDIEDNTVQTGEEVEDHVIRVLVSGGYLYGGYYGESDRYGLLEVHVTSNQVRAKWVHTGQMPSDRSNHTATFIPPRVSGPSFPAGYLLVFAGNQDGEVTNTLDVLDLDTFRWCDAYVDPEAPEPSPRNSHSATLLQVPFLGDAVLMVGGGTGCGDNGGPPRGGHDVTDSWWLSGLESGGPFKWTRAPQGDGRPIAAGRGHVACRLDGTGTVLTVGGGLPPRNMCVAFDVAKGGLRYGGESHIVEMEMHSVPSPRAFGGGCALPGGSLLIYGGWHPRLGTFGDVWIGHVGSTETELFKQVPETVDEETEPQDDDMVVFRRLVAGRSEGRHGSIFGGELWPSEDEEEDSDDLDEHDADYEGNRFRCIREVDELAEGMETSDEDESSDSSLQDRHSDANSAEAALDAIEESWEQSASG